MTSQQEDYQAKEDVATPTPSSATSNSVPTTPPAPASQGGYAQPQQPQQAYQQNQTINVMVSGSQKSVGLSFVLTLLFGPLGMLYSTIIGGIIMMVISLVVGILTLGFGLLITQPICIIWGVMATSNHNKALAAPQVRY